MPRKIVEIANPRRHGETHTSLSRALNYCHRGLAYFLADGRLRFKAASREYSDAYVDPRGTIWWNGALSHYVDERDLAMFPPGCNVFFPRIGSQRAAKRYA